MESTCRLCAKTKTSRQLTYYINDPVSNIEQKLIDCCRWTSFENHKNENLPQRICSDCYEHLNNSWLFAEKVEQAQLTLQCQWEDSQMVDVKPTVLSSVSNENVLVFENEQIEIHQEIKIEPSILMSCPSPNFEYTEFSHQLDYTDTEASKTKVHKKLIKPPEPESPKSFLCDTCGKNFSTYSNLMTHTRIHLPTGNRRSFECYICRRNFRYKKSLMHHIATHSGEKIQFQCKVCFLQFSRSDALRRHNLIHLGQQPHLCHTCGKGFRTKFNLKVKWKLKTINYSSMYS